MQLYYIRHAQSTNNELYVRDGHDLNRQADPQMTALGAQQAEALAGFVANHPSDSVASQAEGYNLNGFGFTHLYCSLMIRSVQTASILGKKLGLPPQAWFDTHERGGIYQTDPDSGEPVGLPGNPRRFFEEHHPDLILPPDLDEGGWWSKGYETRPESRQRADRFLSLLYERHGGSEARVALVSHGGFYQEVMAAVLDVPTLGDHWLNLHNTGMTRVDFTAQGAVVQYMNRLDWLPPALVS